ncbi:MAG: hypothetical protein KDE31_16515, partial [Caldilineaceae bacterium]|nr:hypothetical protein [Caldilineaceae bacterium]
MMATTDRTTLAAKRAKVTMTARAVDQMVGTDRVITGAKVVAVIDTVGFAADGTALTTTGTVSFVTGGAAFNGQRPLAARRTLLQTAVAVGLVIKAFVKAGANAL